MQMHSHVFYLLPSAYLDTIEVYELRDMFNEELYYRRIYPGAGTLSGPYQSDGFMSIDADPSEPSWVEEKEERHK